MYRRPIIFLVGSLICLTAPHRLWAATPGSPGFMLGGWLGAPPCTIVFDKDDGHDVSSDCAAAAGVHFLFKGSYKSNVEITGTFTRVDAAGCRTSVPGSFQIYGVDSADYSLSGWVGCGSHGIGAANHIPLRRVTAAPAAPAPASPAPPSSNSAPPMYPFSEVRPDAPVLAGRWLQDRNPNAPDDPLMEIKIIEVGNKLVGVSVKRSGFLAPDALMIGANLTATGADASANVATELGIMTQASYQLIVDAPDHFLMQGRGGPNDHVSFKRIAPVATGKLACSSEEAKRLPADEAYGRALIYAGGWANDTPTALCWYKLAAELGDAEAQSIYGYYLLTGTSGAPSNPSAGIELIQKAAMHGSYTAALNLSAAFVNGRDLPKSAQRAKYWEVRAKFLDPQFVHGPEFLPIAPWAMETVDECQPSNPTHANAVMALNHGRLAYEARALSNAACWFRISLAQGNQKAGVYLGLMEVFALGMKANAADGVSLVSAAAEAGDPFALMYLANFYRYGIGTMRDDERAYQYAQRALNSPKGLDAYLHVQGLTVSTGEAIGNLARAFQAVGEEQTCEHLNLSARQADQKNCNQGEAFAGSLAKRANPTVLNVEELMPEPLNPEYPVEFAAQKSFTKAKAGVH